MSLYGKSMWFLGMLILIGCSNHQENITKYQDGRIKSIVGIDKKVNHGPSTHYYPNGNIQYYRNYYFGKRKGIQLDYFEEKSGQLSAMATYIVLGNKEVLTYKIVYDLAGNIIEETSRILIEEKEAYGDSIRLGFRIVNPKHDNIQVVIKNYNEYFNELDSGAQVFTADGNSIEILLWKSHSEEYIRGYVVDWGIKQITDSTGITVQESTFFEHKVYTN